MQAAAKPVGDFESDQGAAAFNPVLSGIGDVIAASTFRRPALSITLRLMRIGRNSPFDQQFVAEPDAFLRRSGHGGPWGRRPCLSRTPLLGLPASEGP